MTSFAASGLEPLVVPSANPRVLEGASAGQETQGGACLFADMVLGVLASTGGMEAIAVPAAVGDAPVSSAQATANGLGEAVNGAWGGASVSLKHRAADGPPNEALGLPGHSGAFHLPLRFPRGGVSIPSSRGGRPSADTAESHAIPTESPVCADDSKPRGLAAASLVSTGPDFGLVPAPLQIPVQPFAPIQSCAPVPSGPPVQTGAAIQSGATIPSGSPMVQAESPCRWVPPAGELLRPREVGMRPSQSDRGTPEKDALHGGGVSSSRSHSLQQSSAASADAYLPPSVGSVSAIRTFIPMGPAHDPDPGVAGRPDFLRQEIPRPMPELKPLSVGLPTIPIQVATPAMVSPVEVPGSAPGGAVPLSIVDAPLLNLDSRSSGIRFHRDLSPDRDSASAGTVIHEGTQIPDTLSHPWASSAEGRWSPPAPNRTEPPQDGSSSDPVQGSRITEGESCRSWNVPEGSMGAAPMTPEIREAPSSSLKISPIQGELSARTSVETTDAAPGVPENHGRPTGVEKLPGVEVSRSTDRSQPMEPAQIARPFGMQRSGESVLDEPLIPASIPQKSQENPGKPIGPDKIWGVEPLDSLRVAPPRNHSGMTYADGWVMARDRLQAPAPEAAPRRPGSGVLAVESLETSGVVPRIDPAMGGILGALASPGPDRLPDTIETPQTHSARSSARLADQLSGEVVLMQRLRTATMTAVLRSDSGSELRVDLRRRQGRIEIRATVERGDSQAIAEGWSELQQRLGAQGVHLHPLEREPSRPSTTASDKVGLDAVSDTVGENPSHSGGRGRDSRPSRESEAWAGGELADSKPRTAAARSVSTVSSNSTHRHLLESWA